MKLFLSTYRVKFYLKDILENGLNTKDTFYMLNPRNDLKRTEQMFHGSFKR